MTPAYLRAAGSLAFHFKLSIRVPDLRRSTEFEIHRQGIDIDMVATAWNVQHANARQQLGLMAGARRA